MTQSIWEYIHAYAPADEPAQVTFFDWNDNTLYREVPLKTLGQHGWELVTVLFRESTSRYEYWFKRDSSEGYPPGFSQAPKN